MIKAFIGKLNVFHFSIEGMARGCVEVVRRNEGIQAMNDINAVKLAGQNGVETQTRSVRTRTLMLGTALVGLFACPALAQAAEIKLADALNRFASEANVEVLFSSDVGETHIAERVVYSGNAENDLDKLLEDTGLRFEEPRPGVFIIALLEEPMTPAGRRRVDETIRTAPVIPDPAASSSPDTREVQAQPTAATVPDADPIFNFDAASGVITGQVVDAFSGQPLAGAIVVVEGSGRTSSTDTRGFYRISPAPAGSYSLSVNYIGANFKSQRVTVAPGEDIEANFSLSNSVDDQIVVYANRSALQQALNQQRAASNSATVVSSDLMGDFPAENIAEALRRVSGVTFSRDDATGEGERISVRGFNDQAINIQLNGIDLQGTGIDRGIDLSGFLTDNIKQVTIQKSLLPSQESTGSGGLVEIETRSGLDYGDQYFNVGIEGQTPFEQGFGEEYEISATGAYKLTPDFGVSATVQFRDARRTNYDVSYLQTVTQVLPDGFTSTFRLPESFDYPFDAAFDTPLYTGGNYSKRDREESNLTVSLGAAYDWADHTRLRLDLQQINSDSDLVTARSTQGFLASSINMPVPELNNEVRRRSYVRSLRPTLGAEESAQDLTTTSISFRGETDVSDWEFDYTVGFTRAKRERVRDAVSLITNQNLAVASFVDPSTAVYNLDDDAAMTARLVGGAVTFGGDGIPLLSLSQAGTDFVMDPGVYYVTSASRADAVDKTDNLTFEADVRRYFDNKFLDYVEVGGKYEDRQRDNSDDLLSTSNLTSSLTYIRRFPLNTFVSDLNSDAFGSFSLADIGVDTRVPSLAAGQTASLIDAISGFTVDDPNTPENEDRFRVTDNRDVSAIDSAGARAPALIKERIAAAYFQTKLDFNNVEIIGGLRYQNEDRVGRAIFTPSIRLNEPGFRFVDRAVHISAGLIDFVDTTNVQETLTPSVIANYRPNEEVVVRGAYFRSTIHPSIEKIVRPTQVLLDLRPNFARATIREPNPDLVPSITDNFDVDISYYFKDNPGLIRLGLFYKKTQDNFTETLVADEATTDELRQRALSILAPLTAIDPTLTDLPADAEYFLQRPRNGEGGNIYGFEAEVIRQLDFFGSSAPSWLENFSLLGNITYTKSDFEVLETAYDDAGQAFTLAFQRPLEGQSKWAGNGSVRYEDGAFSGSVIYTYQSASATGYDEFNLNGITPSFDTLDARLSYQIDAKGNMPRMIFFIEGDDLLTSADEADIRAGTGSQFGDGNVDFFFPTRLQFNGGRRVTVGARFTF